MRKTLLAILWVIIFPLTVNATEVIQLNNLQAPAKIYRDSTGIPHIYVHTEQDAYFMMGYIEASDRFFQMDYARHYYEGRLAELLGKNALESDRAIRQIGLPYYAAHSLNALSPQAFLLLQAFSNGVNAYLQRKRPGKYILNEMK